jgi:hypothetical protein
MTLKEKRQFMGFKVGQFQPLGAGEGEPLEKFYSNCPKNNSQVVETVVPGSQLTSLMSSMARKDLPRLFRLRLTSIETEKGSM